MAQHSDTARRTGLFALMAFALAGAMCGGAGQYVWVKDYRDPKPAPSNSYVLAAGDVVSVSVYNQEGMSAKAKIRSDGKISLPFLNDVQAEGYTPSVLAEQLAVRLKDYVNKPVVTVAVDEQRPLKVAVIGEVKTVGVLELPPGSGVLQALATAGGLAETAHDDRIYVIRYDAETNSYTRIRFAYRPLIQAEGTAAGFRLRSGDQLVVE